ncbi:Crp/Fnr family transcriptional regulator [Candidatus Bipolaricaulota bacterium]|nr:Crp/Fnr family transcriptional regulator [Candidatus Bipolaricaulota bacterium]
MLSTVPPSLLERARAMPGVLSVHYGSGELIFPVDGFAVGVYLLERGLVGLFTRGGPGRKNRVHLVEPGEFFGLEGCLEEERPRYRATARALTPVDLLFFPPPVWEKALADTKFRRLVLAAFGQMWVNFLTKDEVTKDGQHAVLHAFQRWGHWSPQGLCLPLKPGLLAQVLGLSRAAVKHALDRLGAVQEGDALVLKDFPNSEGFLDDVQIKLGGAS